MRPHSVEQMPDRRPLRFSMCFPQVPLNLQSYPGCRCLLPWLVGMRGIMGLAERVFSCSYSYFLDLGIRRYFIRAIYEQETKNKFLLEIRSGQVKTAHAASDNAKIQAAIWPWPHARCGCVSWTAPAARLFGTYARS